MTYRRRHRSIPRNAQKLGQGAFSTVYADPDAPDDFVLIQTIDQAKEAMALGWFPNSPLFPELTVYATEYDGDDERNVYRSKRYDTSRAVVSKLDAHNKAFYNALRHLSLHDNDDSHGYDTHNPHNWYHIWHHKLSGLDDQFAEEREALLEALDTLCNYGSDIAFEISPRNVATEGGKLILLDCFFVQSQLKKVRS